MKTSRLVVAVAAIATVAVTAPAFAETADGYKTHNKDSYTKAPRGSIEVLKGGDHDHAATSPKDPEVSGTYTWITVKDLLPSSSKYSQRFTLVVNHYDKPKRFTFNQDGVVVNLKNGKICETAVAEFDTTANTVGIFMDDTCATGLSYRLDTSLHREGKRLSSDTGTLYEY